MKNLLSAVVGNVSLFLVVLLSSTNAIAGIITLDATQAGRTDPGTDPGTDSLHLSNNVYNNDYVLLPDYAGIRVFDLTGITGTVTDLSFTLGSVSASSASNGANVSVNDYLGDPTQLYHGNTVAGARNDLLTGSLGAFTHNNGLNTFSLGLLGMDYVQSHLGGLVAFGLSTNSSDGAFGWGMHSTQTMTVTTTATTTTAAAVPEPSILALMGLGIFGLGLSRRKMKK